MTMPNARLTYFKRSGTYYTEAEMPYADGTALHDVWAQVERLRECGELPGLNSGGRRSELVILVEAPGHPHDHPRLIL